MPRVAKGYVEQLPSGSWRARVYAGIDPLTRREIRLKATAKTEQQAHIELGRLLKQASKAARPESGATWPSCWTSTRRSRHGTCPRGRPTRDSSAAPSSPPSGTMKVRKVRGPILDKLYAELKRCGDLSCTGRPFTEHRNVPALVINPRDPRPAWQQVTDDAHRGHPVRVPRPRRRAAVDHRADRPAGHRDRRHPARPGGARRRRPDHRAPRPRRGRGRGAEQ